MTAESSSPPQKWKRLKTVVRSAAAAIESEPKHLVSLKPLAEEALELLAGKPSLEALEEIDYLMQRIEDFVAKWRPSPNPSPGIFYVQPGWASSTDKDAQEAHRIVQELRACKFDATDDEPTEGTMKIFVSHSSTDKQIAEAFVIFLRAALPLAAKDIRCTSVDGYKLPAGTHSDEQLRQEVFDAQAFLALLSPTSIQSIYVMFELGVTLPLQSIPM
ncbi:toll/interleukin-1 receptor domain-containing protein [Collimonas silvisoli]|uniref:toll/interleukin-1 receptor domain-containing protein n=1 Tax=Collimonas silvisoli TaxID=2825884 RepID=UPI001B8D9018|nr:toll/interleukin-1 receptor domain-containing protein [Collimonas silvisoli]